MSDLKQLEFFLLRYVPDAVKGERVNIGVVLMESVTGNAVFAKARFIIDWKRVLRLFPDADVEGLKSLGQEMTAQLTEPRERELLLKWLRDSASGAIQISGPKGCLADNPEKEIELLDQIYLESMAPQRGTLRTSRGETLRLQMTNSFKSAGVWGLMMKNIAVAPYTRPGDPFKFDFGYRVGDEIKLFHAVPMKTSVNQAITLASRYPKIALGIARTAKARSFLTAVVDNDLDRTRDEVQFALSAMEEEKIEVAIAAEMPMIAERARIDLRV
jgi:hypothetical protein